MKKTIKYICGVIFFIFILMIIVGAISSNNHDITSINDDNDNDNDNDNDDMFKGTDVKLENITVKDEDGLGYFDVHGKIMFKNDESYAEISADVNLKDGSTISESIVENWNNVKKDKWYVIDGMLSSTSGQDYSISDIASVDFKYDDKVIYTLNMK